MKKIFITGGHGFIAGHTVEEAQSRGYKVVTNIRSVSGNEPDYLEDSELYLIDSRDKVAMRSALEKVDGVINLAGLLGTKSVDNSEMFYENNVKAAVGIFDICAELKIPVVQITVGNYFETNDYSNSKVAAERELIKFARFKGLKGNAVRGLNAYGTRQKYKHTGKIIPTFIMQALRNEPLSVYGGQNACGIMDMIWVNDLARILVDVLEKTDTGFTFGQVFEAGTGVGLSVWDVANIIVKVSGSESEIVEVPMRSGEMTRSVVVAQAPYPTEYAKFEDKIGEIIKWYQENELRNEI